MKKISIIFICTGICIYILFAFSPFIKMNYLKMQCLQEGRGYKKLVCLREYFKWVTLSYGATVATEEAVILKQKGIGASCHISSHYIGNANLKRYNNDVQEAFKNCPRTCHDACHHGVMEMYVLDVFDKNDYDSIIKPCEILKEQDKWISRQCYHGLGHGLIKRGIGILEVYKLCEDITRNTLDYKGCISGAAMENVNTFLNLDEKSLRKALPSICNKEIAFQNSALINLCIVQIGIDLSYYTDNNFDLGRTYCEILPKRFIKICTNALASEIKNNISEKTDINTHMH